MRLHEIAHTVLFGDSLAEKLLAPDHFDDEETGRALTEVPEFPGRPAALARRGRAEFPKVGSLGDESARGRVLHFFANHELLALELMALVLLKFPDAPPAFRAGIARTIREEQ